MTTKEIQMRVGKMQVLKYHALVCENIVALHNYEMDVMSISRSGMLYEFEVKVSRADFKADLKKGKVHFYGADSLVKKIAPNYFSYVCPSGLITISEIDSRYGLFYVSEEGIREVQSPRRLHKELHDKIKISERVTRLHQERMYLGCARLTYENKLARERWKNFEIINP